VFTGREAAWAAFGREAIAWVGERPNNMAEHLDEAAQVLVFDCGLACPEWLQAEPRPSFERAKGGGFALSCFYPTDVPPKSGRRRGPHV